MVSRRGVLLGLGGTAVITACGGGGQPAPAPTTAPAVVEPSAPLAAAPSTTAEKAPANTATPAGAVLPHLAVARGESPAAITEAAIAAIGGMSRFVRPGQNVIVKPNICVAYHGPEYAATTNPEVVATVVRLALDAGAARVRVMDYPFGGSAKDAYAISGIQEAVQRAGGEMELMSRVKYLEADFPSLCRDIRRWVVYKDAMEADVIINVPIAKHHGNATLSLGAKNLMGLVDDRGLIHTNLHQRIADLLAFFHPALTVMDAVRVLMAHGPSGGNLDDVQQLNTVIASHDPVAVDAYTTRFFPFATADNVAYIKNAAEMGLGTLDLGSVEIAEVEA